MLDHNCLAPTFGKLEKTHVFRATWSPKVPPTGLGGLIAVGGLQVGRIPGLAAFHSSKKPLILSRTFWGCYCFNVLHSLQQLGDERQYAAMYNSMTQMGVQGRSRLNVVHSLQQGRWLLGLCMSIWQQPQKRCNAEEIHRRYCVRCCLPGRGPMKLKEAVAGTEGDRQLGT